MYIYQKYDTVITYRLIRRKFYGIEAVMKINGKIVCRDSIDDIFRFRKKAESFVRRLAMAGVEPCHLADIVSDHFMKPLLIN